MEHALEGRVRLIDTVQCSAIEIGVAIELTLFLVAGPSRSCGKESGEDPIRVSTALVVFGRRRASAATGKGCAKRVHGAVRRDLLAEHLAPLQPCLNREVLQGRAR